MASSSEDQDIEDEARALLEVLHPGRLEDDEVICSLGVRLPPYRIWEEERIANGELSRNRAGSGSNEFNALPESVRASYIQTARTQQAQYDDRKKRHEDALKEFRQSIPIRELRRSRDPPDYRFAIRESRMWLDWSRVGMIDWIIAEYGQKGIMECLVRDCNFAGVLPAFCDGELLRGIDSALHYYQWPPVRHNDEDSNDDDDEEDFYHCIPFPRAHWDAWLASLKNELNNDVEWMAPEELPAENQCLILQDDEKVPARVRRWRDSQNKGHRLEYWYNAEGSQEFLVLETGNEKVLIVGNVNSHPCLVCNLLQFCNSDGSTPEFSRPERRLDKIDSGGTIVKHLFKIATDTLYSQIH